MGGQGGGHPVDSLDCRYKDHITLIDSYIPDDAIPLYFNAADVVALPYLRASQSGVAHIAMTFGKPIVVSKVGGLEESMADYNGTYFVPPADTTAIKEAIMKIYETGPDVRASEAQLGRHQAEIR